jgi:Ca2+:H+ antiporter
LLNWLLVFFPVVIGLHYLRPDDHVLIFGMACLAILPLAGWMGHATEHLAARTGESIGGLLNATFGNAAELIIALLALKAGLYDVVKASLTGSIIGNLLLVLGLSFVAGGLRYPVQTFNPQAARVQTTLLSLSAISLILPALFHLVGGREGQRYEADLSMEISIILLITYFLSLWFSLKSHKQFFQSASEEEDAHGGEHWSTGKSLLVLALATAAIAWVSEILIGSVEETAKTLGMSSIFVGVIVVAVVGNAAEHSTAIVMARRNRMDLSLAIAIGSSLQIAVFVAPLLVLVSYFIGPRPMDLVFTPVEVVAIALSVAITGQVSSDGESNWFEGAQLLAVYIMMGILFWFLPGGSH